jgi:NADH-quinone oxidoreductase subunit L
VAAASQSGRTGLWILALVGALLTAIYISRATFLTFFGPPRHEAHPHEAPILMRVSLVALAAGAVLGGVIGLSAVTGVLPRFLESVVGGVHAEEHVGPSEVVLTLISVAVAIAGIALAWFFYFRVDWVALRQRFAGVKRTLIRGFYVNDFYSNALVAPAKAAAAFAAYVFDRRVIDGAVEGIGRVFSWSATVGRRVQTGLVRNYALAILLGAVGVLWYVVVRA